MFTNNPCHFHVAPQNQKPQDCRQPPATPLQSLFTPSNTNKISPMDILNAIRALHIPSAGGINHQSPADVQPGTITLWIIPSNLTKIRYYYAKHKSFLVIPCHLNRNQNSIFNATVACPRTAPTEYGTITKYNPQRLNATHIHRKKMSTILL